MMIYIIYYKILTILDIFMSVLNFFLFFATLSNKIGTFSVLFIWKIAKIFEIETF